MRRLRRGTRGKHVGASLAADAAPRVPSRLTGRVVTGCFLVVAAAVGAGGAGTQAFWNDQDAVTGGTISSGTLDLTVDGAQGSTTAYQVTNLTLGSMLPGESVASTVVVANAGNASFTWTAAVSKGGELGPALQVDLVGGATATGDQTAYPRTEGCSAGTTITPGTTATRLNRAASQNLCVKVTLPTATDNTYQGKTTGSVTVTLTATQVTS